MADYGDIERVYKAFNSAVALLHKVRSELETAGYDETSPKWLTVSDGDKPWNFNVDWLGVTYRLAISANVESEQGRFSLKNAKLTISRLSEVNLHNSSITAISEAIVNIRHGSIHFGNEDTRNDGQIYPHHSAEILFFSMIGLPLEF